MENEKNPQQPPEDGWLDDILGPRNDSTPIGPDEQAISSAGLTDPKDLELEALLAEFGAEVKDEPQAALPAEEPVISANPQEADEPFRDEEFRDTFGEGTELEELVTGESQPAPAPAATEAPAEPSKKKMRKEKPQKRRPKHKKGYGLLGIPHILATLVWLGLAIVIGATAGRVLWMMASDVLAFEQEPHTVTITITEEDTLDDIAQQLKDAELIRYPELFKFFAEFTGKAERISVGIYTLNEPDSETGEIPGNTYDYNALLNAIRAKVASRETVTLYFPEGYNCKQIFEKLAENGVCTVEELEEYAANGELGDYWFLEGVERGDKYCLEGYLFPDTYDFYVDDDPGRVIGKFLAAFDNRFTSKMEGDLAEINDVFAEMMRKQGRSEEYIAEHTIGIREIVIIASMIEKETGGADESYTISSVIYNRLASKDFSLLQIDAAVVYANMLVYGDTETVDYTLDSPYNTYLYGGLPIGPISNPGQESLYAALNPEDTNYYYYALYPGTREHEFFTNFKDFDNFCREHGYYD